MFLGDFNINNFTNNADRIKPINFEIPVYLKVMYALTSIFLFIRM